jgi:hypothetical protein
MMGFVSSLKAANLPAFLFLQRFLRGLSLYGFFRAASQSALVENVPLPIKHLNSLSAGDGLWALHKYWFLYTWSVTRQSNRA